MEIISLINEELIDLNVTASNQLNVIEYLALLLEDQGRIESKAAFIQGVLERESEFTTGFGQGIAIPHCKSDTVKQASIVIGKTTKGVDWNALDEQEVTFVIMLAIPAAEGGTTHLQILSALSSKLMDPDFRNHLMNADQKETILNLLDELVVQKTN